MLKRIWFLLFALLLAGAFVDACDDDDDDNDTSDDDDNNDDTDDDDDDDNDNDDNDNDNDDTTANGPDYPMNHAATWDCYICHETNFMGVTTPEPHGHTYVAPGDCVDCHEEGDFNNPPYAGGHNWGQNCTAALCHGANQHGKTFANKNQCLVCHGD
jgi:hypothetical protein